MSAPRPRPVRIPAPARRRALVCGVIAPLVFVVTFTVDGALRPAYSPWSMFVSELSIGPGGWVQRVNFLLSGALVVVFAWAAAGTAELRVGAVPVVVGLLGAGLALSGVANTDPSTMFRPVTTHGLVHAILGAIVFLAMPVSALLVARRLRRTGARSSLRWASLVLGLALIALIVVLKAAELPGSPLFADKGLVQRVILIGWFGGLLSLALGLRRGPGI